MNEFDLIEQIKPKYYKQPTLLKGIGDDGAVFNSQHKHTVTAVDTFVENIHFTRETMSMFQLGYRSLAASVSDLAAMGAKPAFYLVSIIMPKTEKRTTFKGIFDGMKVFGDLYTMDLIGGDTVSGDLLAISVTVIGYAIKGKVRYRHDARDHDIVFVTGTLGDSQAGLYLLQNKYQVIDSDYFIKRHQTPEPRIHFSEKLSNIIRISLNDISDGIVNELHEIAAASKVNIMIDDSLIPKQESLAQFPKSLVENWVYYGGEDFELVGTASRDDWEQIKVIGQQTKTPVTKIGSVNNSLHTSLGQVFLRKNNKTKRLDQSGYIHFK